MCAYAEILPRVEVKSPSERLAGGRRAAKLLLNQARQGIKTRSEARSAKFMEQLAAREQANQRVEATAVPFIHDYLARAAAKSEHPIRAVYTNKEGQVISIENLIPENGKPSKRPAEFGWWRVKSGDSATVFRLHPDFTHQPPDIALEHEGKRRELYELSQDGEISAISGLAGSLEQLANGLGQKARGENQSFHIEQAA